MSTAHGTSDHADSPATTGYHGDHHPHVLPLSVYFGIFFTLLVLTGITVGVSRIDLGSANLLIAMAVATVKALCVALVFMHLLFDKKFNAIVFSSSVIFLAIFIGFTMADTGARGLDGRSSADGPADIQNPFGGTRSQAALQRMYAKPSGKEIKPLDLPMGVKSDIGLHDATATPQGDAVTVDLPEPALAPGVPKAAPSAAKAE